MSIRTTRLSIAILVAVAAGCANTNEIPLDDGISDGVTPDGTDGTDSAPPDSPGDPGTDWGDCTPRYDTCFDGEEWCCDDVRMLCEGSGWVAADPCPALGLVCINELGACGCASGLLPDEISGTVRFPNGIHPVFEALVYIPDPAVGPHAIPPGPHCEECIETDELETGTEAYTFTAPDGTFELTGVPAGPVTLVIEKGYFQKVIEVGAGCEGRALTAEQTRLPGSPSEGTIPSIAVVTGMLERPGYGDEIETVLAKLGLGDVNSDGKLIWGTEEFDLYDGEGGRTTYDGPSPGPDAAPLLRSLTSLMGYHMLFINCNTGLDQTDHFADDADIRANLEQFVYNGGRLYVSDLSYDFVEQAFPDMIDFWHGSDGFSTTPETYGAASDGNALMSPGKGLLHDDDLIRWLQVIDGIVTVPETVIYPDSTIDISGLLGGWLIMDNLAAVEGMEMWVDADTSSSMAGVCPGCTIIGGRRPMTAIFEHHCGKVMMTAYHTHTHDEIDPSAMSAQELVLAFLSAELSVCIDDIQ